MLHHWCRGRGCRGCKRTTKSFDLVKIRGNLGEISENFHKIPENLSKNSAQRLPKEHEELFFGGQSFFLGKFGRILAKIFRIPKNVPAPCCTTTDLFFCTVLGIFGVVFVRALFLRCTRRRYAVRGVSGR